MIEEQFGLTSAPFRLGTDARFYYESEAHRRAMAHLRYGLRLAEGFVVITGDSGVGKTMLVEQLLLDLEGSDVIAAAIQPSGLTQENLPARVLAAFGRGAGAEDPSEALREVLVMERERGAKASLIIDEAQHLSDDVLEALRLLLNLSHEGQALLQVCLLGQTSLRRVLFRPDMEQFRQRVVASHHLPALNADDTVAYIRHRMRTAGRAEGDEVFTEGACLAVFEATNGVPRRINALCGRALMQAALDQTGAIDADAIRRLATEDEAVQTMSGDGASVLQDPDPVVPPANDDDQRRAGPSDASATETEDEERAAERALALVTARTEGRIVEEAQADFAPEPEDRSSAEDEEGAAPEREDIETQQAEPAETAPPVPFPVTAQAAGGEGARRYPVSVGEINAAIRSIQPSSQDGAGPSAGSNDETAAPRPRRYRSPQELMLASSKTSDSSSGPSAGGGATEDRRVPDASRQAAAPTVDRAALDAFLAEVGPALRDLRAAMNVLRERTDALDEARRIRRDRIADEADEAAARLAKLRGE